MWRGVRLGRLDLTSPRERPNGGALDQRRSKIKGSTLARMGARQSLSGAIALQLLPLLREVSFNDLHYAT